MIYKKPKGVKYTDMAIYIDNHIYSEDCDDDLVFQYLYHLVNMFAYKHKFFNRAEYYDDFSIYAATDLFMRLKNPKQFELKEDGTPKLKQIKSILNYIKATLYPRKVDFEQKYYSQAISDTMDEDSGEIKNSSYLLTDVISQSLDKLSLVEFDCCLDNITDTARKFLTHIPYPENSKQWINIYLSCLLTFLSCVTLPNKSLERLRTYKNKFRQDSIAEFYTKEKLKPESVILYHLNENMRGYIFVLVNEMRHVMAKDLSQSLKTYIPSSSVLGTFTLSELNGESTSDN